jgi:hypothetical protein
MKVRCDDCKGTGVIDPCPRCKGTGEIEHDCENRGPVDEITLEYKFEGERLGIYRCEVCGQLWKIRFQYDPGTGPDHIWMKPGEADRGYEFSKEEAEDIGQILGAATVSELPHGWIDHKKCVRELVLKRMRELQTRELASVV